MAKFMTRRPLILSGLLGVAGIVGGLGAAPLFGRGTTASLAGVSVERWGCQYQRIEPQLIAASNLDLIVIDPIVEGERLGVDAISALRDKPGGGKRLVLAYLSVGEAESYRAYWEAGWREAPPSWLGPENPRWPGSFAVRYWQSGWRSLLLGDEGTFEAILTAGFDGVFLDRVDAYGDWRSRGVQAQRDMIDLVTTLSSSAKARHPGFLLIAQNAEPLLANEAYCGAIDAVSKESLLYNLHGEGIANSDADIRWSLTYLEKAQARGLPILAIEYLDDTMSRLKARARLARLGFVPFFGNRLLDRLPA